MIKTLKQFISFITRHYAIIIQPLDGDRKKLYNIHISSLTVLLGLCIIIIMLTVLLVFTNYSTHMEISLNNINSNYVEKSKELYNYIEQVNKCQNIIDNFDHSINSLISITGNNINKYNGVGGSNDINNNIERPSNIKEIDQLHRLAINMSKSNNYMNDLYSIMIKQKEFLSKIPSIWPLMYQDGHRIGNITQWFGFSQNPIYGYFRKHLGIDIAWEKETKIVATADGVVDSITFEINGLGNCIKLKHAYGFFTKYGHNSKIIVQVNENVSKGQVIAYMGSTGMSTGNHCHYEVLIGDENVDPIDYLYINNIIGQ